ncbi:hypothetical protein BT69DRAFT_1213972, partial [Atractiella rhizophila]
MVLKLEEFATTASNSQSALRKRRWKDTEDCDYQDKSSWSLADSEVLAERLDRIRREIKDAAGEGTDGDHLVEDLNSELFRAEIKSEEVRRFFKAKSDPSFAKMAKARPLNPEQLATQRRLQRSLQSVEDSVSQLENHIAKLREKMRDKKAGKKSFQTPSLDSIERSIRNITISAMQRGSELDDLAARMSKL